MSLREIEQKVRKFLSGDPSPQGKKLFDRWYESFDEESINISSEEKQEIKDRIISNIQNKMDKRQTSKKLIYIRSKSRLLRWSAAAAILILLVSYFGLRELNRGEKFVYQTKFGETECLDLPDGSTVILNANSEIKFFYKNPREIWLKGEAFFDVMKLPVTQEIFLVHTEDLIVEVLGTAFNINSRHQKTKVVLEEGSIKLNLHDGQEELMQPGDLISYSSKKTKILERETAVKVKSHSSWKDGAIIYDGKTLGEIIQKVGDHYGIEFSLEHPKLKERVLAGGAPLDNLNTVLKSIEFSLSVKIEKIDDHYLIRQKLDE